jgi:L-lactate dehydrogenase
VITVSSPLVGQSGINGIAISMPAIVGRRGVEEVLNLPLSEPELEAFQSSAQNLKYHLDEMG